MNVRKVLLIEDDETDAFLVTNLVRQAHTETHTCVANHVWSLQEGHAHLADRHVDVVLLDMGLPDSDSLASIQSIIDQHPTVPIIVLTGLDDDITAVAAVKLGAQDYIAKEHLDATVLRRALRYAIERQELLNQLVVQKGVLEQALSEVQTLQGLIRICSECKKVVNDEGAWEAIEVYVRDRSSASFTHGYCPECHQRVKNEGM